MAALYHNLARLDESLEKYAEANALYLKSLRIMQASHGLDHPTTAVVRSNFARSLLRSGQYAEACDVANKAIASLDKLPQANLPVLSECLLAAGAAELALGETSIAAQQLERGLDTMQRHLDATATVESQRQQLVHASRQRAVLDIYLSLPAGINAEAAYPHVLAWKGATVTRARHDRKTMNQRAAGLAAELQRVTVQYASMTLRVPKPAEREAWYRKLFELALHQEALETELAHETSAARGGQSATVHPIALQSALPSGTALIDILEYQHVSFVADEPKKMQFQPRLVAFVVRPDQPLVRVDLGWSKPVNEGVERWRRTRGFPSRNPGDNPAAIIGELVWKQLAPHLEGCQTVLVSPDASLARMPWSVLPGREPNTYLIEDLAIGMITVPQLVPELLAEPAAEQPPKDSLLLIGDVDYEASPGTQNDAATNDSADSSAVSHSLLHFDPLAATGDEIHALAGLFRQSAPQGELLALEKAAATEAAFREAAPRYRWLHVATHGFFAPPNVKSALAAHLRPTDLKRSDGQRQPIAQIGFTSGLALTGANQHAVGGGDDGILMAAELATFDLHDVEVAVLSGCETGLGEIASGEGTLGLQRALQVAGVHTVVSSLWTVPDKKTDLLMQRFYSNLWDKKLSKLAALREAQLWMLRTGGEENPSPTSPAKPLAPHYWAAFILSGDWR